MCCVDGSSKNHICFKLINISPFPQHTSSFIEWKSGGVKQTKIVNGHTCNPLTLWNVYICQCTTAFIFQVTPTAFSWGTLNNSSNNLDPRLGLGHHTHRHQQQHQGYIQIQYNTHRQLQFLIPGSCVPLKSLVGFAGSAGGASGPLPGLAGEGPELETAGLEALVSAAAGLVCLIWGFSFVTAAGDG